MKFRLHYLAILFGSVLLASQSVVPVSADIGDSDNYYNVLLDDESVSIMINEEDHVRIQVINSGMKLEEAFDLASFWQNVCMEECKVKVFATENGPDYEVTE